MSNEVTDLTKGIYRRLYAGFVKGQRINRLSLQAEAWFWRVLASADDFGNADADPGICFAATVGKRPGVTIKHVEKWLDEMRESGLIQMYASNGDKYLHIVGFEELQPAGKNGRRVQRFPSWESGGIQGNPDAVSASYSYSHSDPDPDPEKMVRTAKPRSPSKDQFDDEYLIYLQDQEAYKGINVRSVFSKMAVWCEQRGKVPTRRRLLNWLNSEDKPMESNNGNGTNQPGTYQTPAQRGRAASFEGLRSVVSELRDRSSGTVDEDVRRKSLTS